MMYKTFGNGVVRNADGAFIPASDGNRDYAEFVAWCAAGNQPDIDPSQTLDAVKAAAMVTVSAAAEDARSGPGKYVTPGSGKSMSYKEVADEASRFKATNGAGAYPFLQARVNSGRYPNLEAAADATLVIESQWATVGAAIDEVEDRAKLAIDAATTVEQVRAAVPVTWP